MAGLDFSGFVGNFSQSLVILQFLLWTLIVIGVAFGIYWFTRFKHPVTIHKVLGDGTVKEINTKARLIKKTNELQLFKGRQKINNPPPDFWLSGGKKDKVYIRWDGAGVFVPQKVKYNSPLEFEPAQYNILTQMATRIKAAAERHGKKGFWSEYGQIIMWTGFIVITAVTMWVMFAKLEIVAGSINNLASALRDTSQVIQ